MQLFLYKFLEGVLMELVVNKQAGFTYFLPDGVLDQKVSALEVGPFGENNLAGEINRFLDTSIQRLTRTDTYLLVHSPELKNLESLTTGLPFVDPIIHRAVLDESLMLQLGIHFDHVLQNMLRAGTSDAQGNEALRQALLSLGEQPASQDIGFHTQQYFLVGDLNPLQLQSVSEFLANPELKTNHILDQNSYQSGFQIQVPIVNLEPEIRVDKFDLSSMSSEELLQLNSDRKLAATLEEMELFRDLYQDEKFLKKRKEFGLDERATDVELETWFGLRSEHCFHKEFNARITLEDQVNDPIFKRAAEKGWLRLDGNNQYHLEDGIFKTFIEQPARDIFNKLEKRGKNWIASMFEDNSGVVFYNEDFMYCIKFETHNSPSNKEPVQGAKTGIDGVNRDIFGTMLGTFDALANFFFYCTGDPNYQGWLPKGVKHPYVLLKGITQGVREGGNEMQIPTFNGGLITDPRYIAKALVYCGTVGWSPIRSPTGEDYTTSSLDVSDLLFVSGQAVGIDGIHGATESSLDRKSVV